MDTILVNLIVIGAALFLARWFYLNLFTRNKKPACDSCEACAPTTNSEPGKTQKAKDFPAGNN